MKFVWIVVSLFFVATPTSAEIFKCVGKDGVVVYQNFPCPIDSLGSLPSKPTNTPVPAPAGGANPTSQKPERVEASATTRPIVAQSEPRIGMTADEVRAIWGEPESAHGDELVEGRVDIWTYGDTRSVKFDVNGRVTAVQR
jgi:hypothetical protein